MKLSVFTPLSETGNRYIRETHESMTWQKDALDAGLEVEWIIVPNHGGVFPRELKSRHVRIVEPPAEIEGVGALKKFACTVARGDVLVELDHDDILVPGALRRIADERAADFVFSDFAQFHDGSWAPEPFGSAYGWEGYPVGWEMPGQPVRELIAMRAPPATAQNLRRIEWAPNHVRAWRADFYHKIGGHDARLQVADDHDLMLRTFLAGGRMVHVPECLYLYRVHGAQTVSQRNADIQNGTAALYENNVEALALKFARDAGLHAIDLCGGVNPRAGFAVADVARGVDLNGTWPWNDGTVGVLRASDALEHMRDPLHVMSEAYRVLAPGGFFLTTTPSTEGLGAWCDPTHVSFWNELSFRYHTSAEAQRYIAHALGNRESRFAQTLLRTRAASWDERVKYVDWHAIAVKPGYHHFGWCEPAWRGGKAKRPREIDARPRRKPNARSSTREPSWISRPETGETLSGSRRAWTGHSATRTCATVRQARTYFETVSKSVFGTIHAAARKPRRSCVQYLQRGTRCATSLGMRRQSRRPRTRSRLP